MKSTELKINSELDKNHGFCQVVWVRLATWLRNAKTFHHRIMVRYLRSRGWVVFYLEKQARECKGICRLKLYEYEIEKRA